MGTKVQHTSYLPGFYPMMDLNQNEDGYWSRYYGDKTLSRNNYNSYQLRSSNGYSAYDKEMLKRTMLEHEAIFRKQVYELHRIYRIQKDMMNELKRGPSRHLEASTSNPIFFASHIPSESTNGFQMTTAGNRTPCTVTDDKKTILNFLNRNWKDDGIKYGDMLESNHKGSKRMFDLQLPADVYIDCEEVERSEKEIVDVSSSITNNAKLTLSRVEGASSREESLISDIRAHSGPTARSLADLNEPAKEICFGKGVGSVSTKFLGSKNPSAEIQGLSLPLRSNTSFSGIPSAFLKGRHWDEGASSNHLHVDDDETSREWSLFKKLAGQIVDSGKLFNPGSFKEKFSMPSEQLQLNQNPHDILSQDQTKRETWFTPKIETSQRNLHYGKTATPFPNRSSVTFLNYASAASPLLSSWTKLTNGYSQNYSHNLSSHSGVGADPTYYQNGCNHYGAASQLHAEPITFGTLEGCGLQKSQKDVNLTHTLLNGFHNGRTTQKNNGSETKCEVSSMTLPWLGEKPTCKSSYMMELDLSQGYPQLKMNPRYERMHEMEKNVNLFNLQDLPLSSQVKETTMEVVSDDHSSKKIFGFSIPEKTQQIAATEYDEKDKSQIPLEDLDAKSFRNHINLNIDLNSSNLPAECEMLELPLQQASAPSVAPKLDLEAPIVLEEENPDDDLIREAAESILLISSGKLPPVSYSNLHWFAEVVASSVDYGKENSDYALDSFELATLNLEETKPEEYLGRSWQENQKDDGDDDYGKSNIALLLFTKPRRGQARRRRKRDFRKDILPGLASLSRHEVMEDLQTIGGTMRRNSNRNGTNCRGRKPRSLAVTIEEIHVTPLPPPLEVEIDGQNMIGWGRRTRRCRRQRFTPITNVAAPLT